MVGEFFADTLTGRLTARDRDRDQPTIIRLWTVEKQNWIRSHQSHLMVPAVAGVFKSLYHGS